MSAPLPADFQHRATSSPVVVTKPSSPEKPSAADFTVQDGNGRSVRLSDFRGKVVLLDFWAIGCGACRPALSDASALARRFPRDLVVLAVDVWDTPEAFRSWQRSNMRNTPRQRIQSWQRSASQPLGLTLTVDAAHEAARRYDVLPLPDAYLLDREGRIRAHWVSEMSNQELTSAVQKAIMRHYIPESNKPKLSDMKPSDIKGSARR